MCVKLMSPIVKHTAEKTKSRENIVEAAHLVWSMTLARPTCALAVGTLATVVAVCVVCAVCT